MLDYQGQISIPVTMARGLVFVSAVISSSLTNDATDAMKKDNLVTALSAQIQISLVLIGTFRKPSVEPIVLAKRWGIISEKAQTTIQATTQRETRNILHPSLLRWMIGIFVIIAWHILYS